MKTFIWLATARVANICTGMVALAVPMTKWAIKSLAAGPLDTGPAPKPMAENRMAGGSGLDKSQRT